MELVILFLGAVVIVGVIALFWHNRAERKSEYQREATARGRRVHIPPTRAVPVYRPTVTPQRVAMRPVRDEPARSIHDPATDLMSPLNPMSPTWIGHSFSTPTHEPAPCHSHDSHSTSDYSHSHSSYDSCSSYDSGGGSSYDSGGSSFDSGGSSGGFD